VNWQLVEKTLNYVKNQLLDLAMPTERHIVIAKYNLEEVCKSSNPKMIDHVWDNRLVGNRHIVVDWELACLSWNEPMDYSGGKSNEQRQFAEKIRQEIVEHQMYYGWISKSKGLDFSPDKS
jgi:hypothetical protein